MKKKDTKDNIYRISSKRIILIYLGIFVVFELIFYLSFQGASGSLSLNPLKEVSFYIYTPILLGLAIMFTVMSVTQTYFVLEGTRFLHVKMGKTYAHNFHDIIYVDVEWSRKHKMMLFFDKNIGKVKYLAFDKEHVIFDKVLEKSPLIDKETFKIKYPHIKL